jgi:hypothetical protein
MSMTGPVLSLLPTELQGPAAERRTGLEPVRRGWEPRMLPLNISAAWAPARSAGGVAMSGRRESNPRSRSGAPVCRHQHFARKHREQSGEQGSRTPRPRRATPCRRPDGHLAPMRTLQRWARSPASRTLTCPVKSRVRSPLRHGLRSPTPRSRTGTFRSSGGRADLLRQSGMRGRRRDAPRRCHYSFVRGPSCPPVPSALTPSSLGCARDEHRSAWFRTQDSNLEFAVQSRASCQLDQSGSVPPEGLEPPTTGLKVRDDRRFTTEANEHTNGIRISFECAYTFPVRGAPGSRTPRVLDDAFTARPGSVPV